MQFLSLIDRVYVVNLASRDDRRKTWLTLANKLPQLSRKLEIYTAVDGKKLNNTTKLRNGELGCSMSHAGIWRDARGKGYRFILVFEDDVLFKDELETKLETILTEVQSSFDWIYLFNTWDYRPVEPFTATLNKVIASLGTQAYLINVSSIDRLLPFVEEYEFPIDVVMGHMSFLSKVYRPKEIFVEHNEESASDIASPVKKPVSLIQRLKSAIKQRIG